MTNFHVGQLVVCVDASGSDVLEKGRVYTLSGVGIDRYGVAVVDLEGIDLGPPYPAWFARRFRPVKETSIQIFRDLVAPIKDKVRA